MTLHKNAKPAFFHLIFLANLFSKDVGPWKLKRAPKFQNLGQGLETYYFSNSQTFASGLDLNSQITVSYSQLVLLYLLICCLRIGYDKVFKRDKRRKTSQF